MVKVKDHHRAAHQPLAVKLAPGGLPPAGLGHGEVQPPVIRLLPVAGGDDVGQGIGPVVHDALGLARGTGGEVHEHGVFRAGRNAGKRCRLPPGLFRQVPEAGHRFPDRPQQGLFPSPCDSIQHMPGHLILRGADKCLHGGAVQPVGNVLCGQHVRHRDQDGPQLVQGQGHEPVFIVALQRHHHPVPRSDARLPEDTGHPVAAASQVRKRKRSLCPVGVAPHHGHLLRGLAGHFVGHVIRKVELCRPAEADLRQSPGLVKGLPAVAFIEIHRSGFLLSLGHGVPQGAETGVAPLQQIGLGLQLRQFFF